jgi:hypothetical protein
MAFLDFLFGRSKPARRRRRRTTSTTTRKRPQRASARQAQQQLDRQAAAWLRADNARRRREQEQRDRAQAREQRQRIRVMRIETEAARRADAAYRRQKARLLRDGWSAQEADELLSGYQLNPSQREARMRAACQCLALPNPSAEELSQIFHGRPDNVRDGRVVIGQVESITYRAPRSSRRAGLWEHAALDRGAFRAPAKRKTLLVADPTTGRVAIAGGDMRFSPSKGLVG